MKIAAQTVLSGVVGIVTTLVPSSWLAVRDPAALRRRMKAGPAAESRPVQRFAVSGTVAVSVAVAVLSAVDHRFGWSDVPVAVVIAGNVAVLVGLGAAELVVIQNRYAAATVTVEAGQPVVSTGLYGLVRHPMYAGAMVMMVGMPLALGSYWGLLPMLAGVPILVARILDEEKLLAAELPGYREYQQTVRYRVLPRLW
ncbi:methyltransferase family protein [Mycolicibacterium litorale]|uniref:methyltransferase family protein n=1 Tax=Mycolicibacterium litorale TaxID=758802 RepID=UPI003CF77F91